MRGYVPPGVRILAKLEKFNPGGSSKDRAALFMLLSAYRSGKLEGRTLVEASSGNTGISLAMIGASLGVKVLLFVPEGGSEGKIRLAREYGAEVIPTPAEEGTDGAIRRVRELVREAPDRFFHPDQYNNPLNPLAHYRTTGPEIWEQTGGTVTHFVAGVGTGGTVSGTGRFLKERNPSVKVIGVQPASPTGRISGLKHIPTSIRPGVYDPRVCDGTEYVSPGEAEEWRVRLARYGISVGPSSGAVLAATVRLAEGFREGDTVVLLFPDGGERYRV